MAVVRTQPMYHKHYQLVCDKCGVKTMHNPSQLGAEIEAHKKGWSFRPKHLCPKCKGK